MIPREGQPWRFGGKELLSASSLDLYDFEARLYDPALGRFLQPDPMAEKYYDVSPYCYCADNPVAYVDPDGKLPNFIVGALIGAAADYAAQVTVNVLQGKTIGKAFTEVDGKSILCSAAMGAMGAGIGSSVSKMLNAGKVVTAVAEAGSQAVVAGSSSVVEQYVSNGKINPYEVGAEMAVSALGSMAGSIGKQVARTKDAVKTAERQLDHAVRVAGNNPRPSRAAKVAEATQKLESIGDREKGFAEAIATVSLSPVKEFVNYK